MTSRLPGQHAGVGSDDELSPAGDVIEGDAPLHPGGHARTPFRSFWMGGIEGADHINSHRMPLDMAASCGHRQHLDEDFRQLAARGIHTVRESVGWRLSEHDGRFDFGPAVDIARAARAHGVQVLWTLMHYGTPADVSLLDDAFADRFARFAAQAAVMLGEWTDGEPVYTPINEISFLSWAVSETRMLHPYGPDAARADAMAGSTVADGFAVKRRLVEGVLKGVAAIREVDPRARFLHVEPVVHVVPPADRPELQALAEQVSGYQWQAWDMISGRMEPGLGGSPDALDLIGVNHYHNGQWEVVTEKRLHWHLGDPRRRPLSHLLKDTWQRYRRPLMLSETSHVGEGRAAWLEEVATEVQHARLEGVPVHGICLYPIFDRTDWEHADHWHHSGLWDHCPIALQAGQWPRRLDPSYAAALARWQDRLPGSPRPTNRTGTWTP